MNQKPQPMLKGSVGPEIINLETDLVKQTPQKSPMQNAA